MATATLTPTYDRALLLPQDRCDRCGARASVSVNTDAGELIFCGHDFTRHEAVFAQRGYSISDQRQG